MSAKEAKARIKINKLLEEAGWRFFDDASGPANIQVEANVKLSKKQIDDLGDNFEKTKNGFVDFLLLDENGNIEQSQLEPFMPWSKDLPVDCYSKRHD